MSTKKKSKSAKRLSLEGQLKAARTSLEQYIDPTIIKEDKLIPKEILKNAKGIVFLTVIKAGFIFAGNVGTGCVIVRNASKKQNTITGWSPPSSLGCGGVSFGFLAGGAKVDYILILNHETAVKQFMGNGQLRVGGNIGLALGPVGRGADASVGAGDGGVSAVYSYVHQTGLYGGLELDGKIITTRPKCNEKFFSLKGVKCKDILAGNIPMPQNNDYDKIISLLNSYCLDYAFPQSIEEKVDIEAILKKNDLNVENAVNTLHSMFNDIDVEVIRLVLMEQCWGNMDQCADILLTMTKKNDLSKKKLQLVIEESDTDVKSKKVTKNELIVIANAVKDDIDKKAAKQNVDALSCYEVVEGCVLSRTLTAYHHSAKKPNTKDDDNKDDDDIMEKHLHYKIKMKIGDNRYCMIKVEKSEPVISYILEDVDFIDTIVDHDKEEKQMVLMPYSSNKLVKIARTTTKRHLDLSDHSDLDADDIDDDNKTNNPPIFSTIGTKYANAPGNFGVTLPMLDNLINSFDTVDNDNLTT